MIVADTSALIAIIMRETGYDRVVATIHGQRVILPASCYLEAAEVLAGRRQGRAFLDRLLEEQDAEFVSIDEPTIRIAADAFERYGKGRGHPAQLNFGDCMSYAVAKRLDAALLFVGRDLIHTDLRRAVPV